MTTPRTIDDVIRDWTMWQSGRTQRAGRQPKDDELMLAEVKRLRAENQRLRAAQPMTADGAPVVSGMEVWFVEDDTDVLKSAIVDVYNEIVCYADNEDDGRYTLYWHECYSTREAAEAAMKASPTVGGGP